MENNIKEPDMPLSPEELCGFCRGCAELLQNPVNATSVFNTFGRPEAEDPFSSEGFQREFARLFYGVGDETIPLTATPWSGLKVSDPASPMKQCADLYLFSDVKNTAPLPPDHLAVQLSFLAHLLSEGKIREAAEFRDAQILSWLPRLNSAIRERSRDGALTLLFSALEEFLREANLKQP